jgi:hypothetical protein
MGVHVLLHFGSTDLLNPVQLIKSNPTSDTKMSHVIVTLDGYWIDNWIYWITVYTLQFNTVHFTTVFPLSWGPGPHADPTILRRVTYSTLTLTGLDGALWLKLLPWLYNLETDPVGNTALTLCSGQPFPSNAFFLSCLSSRYQVTSTPQAYMSHYTTDLGNILFITLKTHNKISVTQYRRAYSWLCALRSE